MDPDEKWFTERLRDKSVSDADHNSCIDMLQALSAVDALPVLLEVLTDNSRSWALRLNAALAINELGVSSIRDDLVRLSNSAEDSTRELAGMALSG